VDGFGKLYPFMVDLKVNIPVLAFLPAYKYIVRVKKTPEGGVQPNPPSSQRLPP
jgi:hypothetical protein